MSEPVASSIILTPGTSPGPAPAGKTRLYQRSDGVMVRIDDSANETIVGRDGTQVPAFGELSNVDLTDIVDGQTIKLVSGIWVPTDLIEGPTGPPPDHEWNGTQIRFQNSDGSWGDLVDLQGETGDSPDHEWDDTSVRFKKPDGTWGVYTNLKGDQGNTGATGATGDTPEHEWNGTQIRFQNADGTWGDWTDVVGPTGADGADGVTPEHEWIDTALRFKRADGNWGALTDLKGDQGEQGPQGETGEAGCNLFKGIFFAKNLTWQSLLSQSSIDIDWDSRVLTNTELFSHSQSDNPSEITILFDGYIEVSFKLAFLNQDSDIDILVNGKVSLNNNTYFDECQAYDYTRYKNYGNIASPVLPPTPIQVSSGDVLRIHAQASKDTSLGDRLAISTIYGQSTLRIQAYPEE